MSAFKVLHTVLQIFYLLDIVVLPHFSYLKNMLPNNLNKISVHILTFFLAFSISALLTSSNLTSGGISSDFISEERKLKKLWILVESLTSFFGLPFWPAYTLSILLPIIPFWSSWALSQISHFSECWVQLLNGVVLIVLCLLMVVEMTITLAADFFRVYLWIVTRCAYPQNIFFQFCVYNFPNCNFLSQKLTTDLIRLVNIFSVKPVIYHTN